MPYVIAQPCVDVKDKACVDEVPRRLHLRGFPLAVHQPQRVRRLRCMRTGVSHRGHLL